MEKTKQLKVIEVPASGKPGWYGGAYCHFFMYTKHNGNFLLKGYHKELEQWIEDNNITKYAVNKVYFGKDPWGEYPDQRSYWCFYKKGVFIMEPSKRNKKFEVYSYDGNERTNKLEFKRFPKRWIPEFDVF